MIESYDDLYAMVESAIEKYATRDDAEEMVFEKNANGTCTLKSVATGRKFVLMFARFGDEYKVGFAFYEPDPLGGAVDPSWIEDIFNHEFDENFVITLITEHLVTDAQGSL